MSNTIKKTEETEPENLGYSLNYPKFYNVTDGEEYLNQLVWQTVDCPPLNNIEVAFSGNRAHCAQVW